MPQKLPNWNLKEYYSSIKDPKLKKDEKLLYKKANTFINKFKNKISQKNLTPGKLSQAIEEYQDIWRMYYHLSFFIQYNYDTDQNNQTIASLYQHTQEMGVEISKKLLFFALEIKQLPEAQFNQLIKQKKLKEYKYFLQGIYIFKPHTLSLEEEKILSQKCLPARQAWQRLHELSLANIQVKIKNKKISFNEAIKYLFSHNRETRRMAMENINHSLKEHSQNHSLIYNTLLLDKNQTDKIRNYTNPEDQRILANGDNFKALKELEKITLKNYKLSIKHYKLKSQALGYKLYDYDRYAPMPGAKDKEISFLEAKKIILSAFENFDPEFKKMAQMFFDKKWIDVPVKKGKCGGAYCSFGTDKKNPRILVNFTGSLRDVLTLAHEIGHGIHDLYAKKNNNLLNMWTPLSLAELASTFCESVVFEYILQKEKNNKVKLNLISNKIEDITKTVFRQIAFYRFEKQAHFLRKQGEIPVERMQTIWQKELQAMFGSSLKLTGNHLSYWQYVSHFFSMPFYVYAYAYGGLISLSLYNKYKEANSELEKQKFIEQYKQVLMAGGNDKPEKILKIVGIDVVNPATWQSGFEVLKNLINQEEKLIKKI